MTGRAAYDVQVCHLSAQDAGEVFDRLCRRELGISGSDFLAKWDAGDYSDVALDDIDGLAEVVGAIALVR